MQMFFYEIPENNHIYCICYSEEYKMKYKMYIYKQPRLWEDSELYEKGEQWKTPQVIKYNLLLKQCVIFVVVWSEAKHLTKEDNSPIQNETIPHRIIFSVDRCLSTVDCWPTTADCLSVDYHAWHQIKAPIFSLLSRRKV